MTQDRGNQANLSTVAEQLNRDALTQGPLAGFSPVPTGVCALPGGPEVAPGALGLSAAPPSGPVLTAPTNGYGQPGGAPSGPATSNGPTIDDALKAGQVGNTLYNLDKHGLTGNAPPNGFSRALGIAGNINNATKLPGNVSAAFDAGRPTEDRVKAGADVVDTTANLANTKGGQAAIAQVAGKTAARRLGSVLNPVGAVASAVKDGVGTYQTFQDPNTSWAQRALSTVRTAGSAANAGGTAVAATGIGAVPGAIAKGVGSVVGGGADLLGSWLYGNKWR